MTFSGFFGLSKLIECPDSKMSMRSKMRYMFFETSDPTKITIEDYDI